MKTTEYLSMAFLLNNRGKDREKEDLMLYDLDQLRELAWKNLAIARDNLLRDGYVQTCGLVWTDIGLSHIIPIRFESLNEKRRNQEAFRVFLRKSNALAAAVIMETWMKHVDPREPLDPTRSIADLPGRQEAIVIELRSTLACFGLIQVFNRNGRCFTLEEPIEMNHPAVWVSEWLDQMWTDSQACQRLDVSRVS